MTAHNFWQTYNQLYIVTVTVNRKLVLFMLSRRNMIQLKFT